MKARELTADEFRRLFSLFYRQGGKRLSYAALLLVMVSCGARVSEVTPTRRSDFLEADGTLKKRFRRIKLKTHSEIETKIGKPLPDEVREILREWFDWQKRHLGARRGDFAFAFTEGLREPSYYYFYRVLKRACTVLEINPHGISTHSARKTFAMNQYRAWHEKTKSQMLAARKVQKLLGHKDINTTLVYLGIDDDDPEQLIGRIGDWIRATISEI